MFVVSLVEISKRVQNEISAKVMPKPQKSFFETKTNALKSTISESYVLGLVYLAAYGPDSGESVTTVSANAPQTELSKYLVPSGGYVFISEEGVKTVFANDLKPKQQALIYATQTPASHTVFDDKSGEPAWKNKPTWFVVAKNDKTIHPDLERFMAKRMKAKTTELPSSHVVMLSHPQEVLKVIEEAANSKY